MACVVLISGMAGNAELLKRVLALMKTVQSFLPVPLFAYDLN